MPGQISVSKLLKGVVGLLALMAVCLAGMSVFGDWRALVDSWRVLAVADVSEDIFKVLAANRAERSGVTRYWTRDSVADAQMAALRETIAGSDVALQSARRRLATIEFADRFTLLPAMDAATEALTAGRAGFFAGMALPRAQRDSRAGDAAPAAGLALTKVLETISARLTGSLPHTDSFVDQMLTVSKLALEARRRGGEASLVVTMALASGRAPANGLMQFQTGYAAAAAHWAAIEMIVGSLPMDGMFKSMLAEGSAVFLNPEVTVKGMELLRALETGAKPSMTDETWSPYMIGVLQHTQTVAQSALASARAHAREGSEAAGWRLVTHAGVLLAAAFAAITSIILVKRRVTWPLEKLCAVTLSLGRGDLSVDAPFTERQDEMGALGRALASFRSSALETRELEAQREAGRQANEERVARLAQLTGAFEANVGSLVQVLGSSATELEATAQSMSSTADATNQQSADVANAADQASANSQTVAASTEQLSASIREISQQVSRSSRIAEEAVEQACSTEASAASLAEAGQKIDAVVQLIRGIADKTNLLALNATIEAARAGDAGKGFAVVASEVKSLARQTSRATEEITGQVAAVQGATTDMVQAIGRIGTIIRQTREIATAIASAVEQQSAAAQEIATSVQQAARATGEVTRAIGGINDAATSTTHAADQVLTSAASLSKSAETLTEQVGVYIASVRAA